VSTIDPLFEPGRLGDLQLPHRVVMAPLTRSRAAQPGDVPTAMNARYYAQRADAALIIFTPAQVAGWRLVTEAVHACGGRIVLQLWHVGRASHHLLLDGRQPLAPSEVHEPCKVWLIDPADGKGKMVESSAPRAMTLADIDATIGEYAQAARHATLAGFDGIEIHAANGYLPEQFLASNANLRSDAYGGSVAKRARFLLDVVEACSAHVPLSRIGVRLSPLGPINGIRDADPSATYGHAAAALHGMRIGYLHLADTGAMMGAARMDEIVALIRPHFAGDLMLNGAFEAMRARAALAAGIAQAISFGRPFIANPDLPRRLREGVPLAAPDMSTFYGGGSRGYDDYPVWSSSAATPAPLQVERQA
jgi:N-ethylmaleimide reductase